MCAKATSAGRDRKGGQQFVGVERAHLNAGEQPVIGNVKKSDA
jgi:hypothetical protein